MRGLIALTIFSVISLFPHFYLADSGLIVKASLWHLIAEEDQVAVIKLDKNGAVDVSLFISIVDKSGKSNTVHLVLPFRDRPISLRAEELMLADFKRQHVEAIESRERQIRTIRSQAQWWVEINFRFVLTLGFPLGIFLAEALTPPKPEALPPGLQLGGAKALSPELVVTTEHTRTEVYRIERPTDVEHLLQKTGVSKEQLERLKRQLVGRYLYLVTVKTVPLSADQQTTHPEPEVYRRPIREEERLGVVFHVQLESQREGHKLTFTYPLGTGETWWHPISLTELFILTPPDGSIEIRYPRLPAQNRPLKVGTRQSWQRTFFGRDEFGHIVRLTYGNANPSEDVVIRFDPTKKSKIPTAETAEKVGRFSWLLFLALLLILWFPSLWLFVGSSANHSMSVSSFFREAPAVGFLWAVFNGFFGLIAWASLDRIPLLVRIYEFWWQWEEVELMLLFLLLFVPTALFILALLPSMSLHRLKLMGVAFGILLVLFVSLLLPVILPFLALSISSLVIYFWLRREGGQSPTYWQCLTFSLLFGLMFAAVSLIIRDIFFAFINVNL